MTSPYVVNRWQTTTTNLTIPDPAYFISGMVEGGHLTALETAVAEHTGIVVPAMAEQIEAGVHTFSPQWVKAQCAPIIDKPPSPQFMVALCALAAENQEEFTQRACKLIEREFYQFVERQVEYANWGHGSAYVGGLRVQSTYTSTSGTMFPTYSGPLMPSLASVLGHGHEIYGKLRSAMIRHSELIRWWTTFENVQSQWPELTQQGFDAIVNDRSAAIEVVLADNSVCNIRRHVIEVQRKLLKQRKEARLKAMQVTEMAHKAIKRAYKLFSLRGQEPELHLFINGSDVEISHPDSDLKFVLKRHRNRLISGSTAGHLGWANVRTDVYTKSNVFVAGLCVYLQDTPILDQLMGMMILIRSGQENLLLEKGNVYSVSKDIHSIAINNPILDAKLAWHRDLKKVVVPPAPTAQTLMRDADYTEIANAASEALSEFLAPVLQPLQ